MAKEQKPDFVTRKPGEMIMDNEYTAWIAKVKKDFLHSQAKAAVRVNRAMLEFYWQLGRDIETLHAEARWGSAFFENLSLDLRREFPRQKGFSVTNLKYAKRWYSFYSDRLTNRQNRSDDFLDAVEPLFRQNCSDEIRMPECFALIPWWHHVDITVKCQTLQEALFYVNQTIENSWIEKELKQRMEENLFATKGKALTNFKTILPAVQAEQAQAVLKDPYHFGFLRLDDDYDEHDLEDALVNNITHFLLELGQGFAFVGRQMELRMSNGKSYFPDLIFYHIKLHSYVVVELKVVDFMPEFAGKLNFYVSAADELLRGEGDNPSIGLVICKSSDKTTIEWSFRGITTPIGVATYELEEVVNRTFSRLPKDE